MIFHVFALIEMSYEYISFLLVTKKTLESPLDCKKIKPVNPEVNQSLIFTRRTDAEAEALLLGPPHAKN